MQPTLRVSRELYYRSPGQGIAQWLAPAYAGPGLARAEILSSSAEPDAYRQWFRRRSGDNGRNWSGCELISDAVRDTPDGGMVTYPSHGIHNPVDGKSYRFFMRRQWPGLPCYTFDWKTGKHPLVDHVFVAEDGGPEQVLRYEDGAAYDPGHPFAPAFLNANQGYLGNAPAFGADGTVYFPICIIGNGKDGVILFRLEPKSGEWLASNRMAIAPELSSRGLLEPEAAVLKNGRIFIVCRGSNTATTPGRKWRILSEDGGRTLQPVEELRHDDGERFYSPSSIHRFIRSRRNGALYWLANIVPDPPQANGPRYPLYLAEIDEERAAVRREGMVMIDTRRPGEPEALQLSNFSVLEDRSTANIEIYITLLGLNPGDFWRADVYRYVLSP